MIIRNPFIITFFCYQKDIPFVFLNTAPVVQNKLSKLHLNYIAIKGDSRKEKKEILDISR